LAYAQDEAVKAEWWQAGVALQLFGFVAPVYVK